MSGVVATEVIFSSKDGNACLYDFRDFAVILTYLVEDAFMPLGISFEILLGERYQSKIEQWMCKFRSEDELSLKGDRWTSAIIDVPAESVERIRHVAEDAISHPSKDHLIGQIFTAIFPNFPK